MQPQPACSVSIQSNSSVESDGLKINHGIMTLNGSDANLPHLLDFKAILEYPAIRPKWDPAFASAEIISLDSEKEIVAYSKTRSFWPVQFPHSRARDLVVKFTFGPSAEILPSFTLKDIIDTYENGFLISAKSCDYPLPPQNGYTRAHLHYANFTLNKSHNQVTLDYRVKSNPKGMIPLKLLGMLSDMVPKNLELIYNYLETHGSPPCVYHNQFGSICMKMLDFHEDSGVLTLQFDFSSSSTGVCFSLVRISPTWLKKNQCTSVDIEVNSTDEECFNISYCFYKGNMYFICEISIPLTVKFVPVKHEVAGVYRNGLKISNNDDVLEQTLSSHLQAQGTKSSDTSASAETSSNPESPDLLIQATFLSSLQQIEKFGLSKKDEKLCTLVDTTIKKHPDPNHPTGLIHSRKVIKIPEGYASQAFVTIIRSIITNQYSRKVWDSFFHGATILKCCDVPEDSHILLSNSSSIGRLKLVKSSTKAIWPVTPRVIYAVVGEFVKDDITYIVASSIPKENTIVFDDGQHIIATLDLSMWRLRAENGFLEIVYGVKTNPNGDIPMFLVEKMAQTFPTQIQNVLDYQKTHGAFPNLSGEWSISIENDNSLKYSHQSHDVKDTYMTIDNNWIKSRKSLSVKSNGKCIVKDKTEKFCVSLVSNTTWISFTLILQKDEKILFGFSDQKKSDDLFSSHIISKEFLGPYEKALKCMELVTLEEENPYWPIITTEVDLDADFLESRIMSDMYLRKHLKISESQHVKHTDIPHFYLFNDYYILRNKWNIGNDRLKTVILLLQSEKNNTTLHTAFVLQTKNTVLKRKTDLQIFQGQRIWDKRIILNDLKVANHPYFKCKYLQNKDDKNIEEKLAKYTCTDFFLVADPIYSDNLELLISPHFYGGSLVLPKMKTKWNVLFDSKDTRVKSLTCLLLEEKWVVNDKLRSFWIVQVGNVMHDLSFSILVQASGKSMPSVYINGVCYSIHERKFDFTLGLLILIVALSLALLLK